MTSPNASATANASSACDAWITTPLTKSCGVGNCSNATGVPTCVCSPGWSGVRRHQQHRGRRIERRGSGDPRSLFYELLYTPPLSPTSRPPHGPLTLDLSSLSSQQVGDFDFRHLEGGQDADCDKYPALFRTLYFLGAAASFVNMFCNMYMYKMARSKKGRKKTTAMLLTIATFYGWVLWGFRGIDPGRSIGVDPVITILFAGYFLLLWSTATYVITTGTYSVQDRSGSPSVGRWVEERLL